MEDDEYEEGMEMEMRGHHYGGGAADEMEDEEVDGETPDEEITQEDALAVISAYFEENDPVRQQLDASTPSTSSSRTPCRRSSTRPPTSTSVQTRSTTPAARPRMMLTLKLLDTRSVITVLCYVTVGGMVDQVLLTTNADDLRFLKLIECIMGKVSAHMGKEGDATPFTDVTVDNISKALHKCGYQMCGFETMYNGHTGRKLTAMIFVGPTYYQRLKHMVDDKIHSRGGGPVQILTRQPAEGRSCDGANLKKNSFECKGCKNKTDIVQVHIPNACKLLFQELMAMAIAPRMLAHDIKTGKDQKKR
ncbi:hypothetical protein GUJ93_ZPchr0003g18369 [Zizania palustris]|uniref:DNA-directed RNA polymerase n=1 Tax=Zizania palustris TaxID=103762 RepID=A0A8J5SGC3_ZIZPA|nr:hypothetical protein GUJ93_ZPchr0003g18369 [Zizania palustris]